LRRPDAGGRRDRTLLIRARYPCSEEGIVTINRNIALKIFIVAVAPQTVLASEADADLVAVFSRYREFHERFPDFFGFTDDAEARAMLGEAFREVAGLDL
jgi:hypothetical protein